MRKIFSYQNVLLLFLGWTLLCIGYFSLKYAGIIKEKTYTNADFGIDTVVSPIDFNQNGVDDYTDIVNGAILEGKKRPKYKSAYYKDGYPPNLEGVCTDLIWRALKHAGYDLKSLVDEDIKNNKEAYTKITTIDSNIDFRRVYNLHVFFERNTLSLTTDITQLHEFQPGDILIFEGDKHIGIVSNKRNKKGRPYLLHHTPRMTNRWNNLEEDVLGSYKIIGHYRFQLKNEKTMD